MAEWSRRLPPPPPPADRDPNRETRYAGVPERRPNSSLSNLVEMGGQKRLYPEPTLPAPTESYRSERLEDLWRLVSRVGGMLSGLLLALLVGLPAFAWLSVWLREPLTVAMHWYLGLFP